MLQVGPAKESITAETAVELLKTADASVREVVDQRSVSQLSSERANAGGLFNCRPAPNDDLGVWRYGEFRGRRWRESGARNSDGEADIWTGNAECDYMVQPRGVCRAAGVHNHTNLGTPVCEYGGIRIDHGGDDSWKADSVEHHAFRFERSLVCQQQSRKWK